MVDVSRLLKNLKRQTKHSVLVKSSRHSAAIVYKNRMVLAYGNNKRKTHPMAKRFQGKPKQECLHAEVDAIVKTISRYGMEILKDCDLYVLRITKGGQIANSKPCAGCQSAIDFFGIQKSIWTENSPSSDVIILSSNQNNRN